MTQIITNIERELLFQIYNFEIDCLKVTVLFYFGLLLFVLWRNWSVKRIFWQTRTSRENWPGEKIHARLPAFVGCNRNNGSYSCTLRYGRTPYKMRQSPEGGRGWREGEKRRVGTMRVAMQTACTFRLTLMHIYPRISFFANNNVKLRTLISSI